MRNILEPEEGRKELQLFLKPGGRVTGKEAHGPSPVRGLWKLRERHFQLMIAYNHASYPEFDNADLTLLLEYHQWIMEKAIEGTYDSKRVYALMLADFQMRTRWMLSWRSKEFNSFSEVVRHHRGHSAYLFSDLPAGGEKRQRSRSRSRSRPRKVQGEKRQRSRSRSRSRPRKVQGNSAAATHNTPPKADKGSGDTWQGLVRINNEGKRICPFYNKTKGCLKGSRCADEHECDYPGCGRRHSRAAVHPKP